ncbi:MAG TPA: hypothetical protein VGL61_07070 [Kofleriaceae bacterium]|jgi:hypothetical protein
MKWLALVVAVAACDSPPSQPSGIGPYKFGHTTAAMVHDGNCQPTDLNDGRKAIWCFALPPIKVGKHVAEVDTYFSMAPPYTKDDAPLIEIQLKVRGCVEDEADAWMRERFGAPIETKSTREYWKNSFLWAAAFLPSEPGRCVIHLLPLSENAEIARLKSQ